jgi:hypothetical protein
MKITQIIALKHTLQLIGPLQEVLKDRTSVLFRAFKDCVDDARFGTILRRIDRVIEPDIHFSRNTLDMRMQKCRAVKSGLSGLAKAKKSVWLDLYLFIHAALLVFSQACWTWLGAPTTRALSTWKVGVCADVFFLPADLCSAAITTQLAEKLQVSVCERESVRGISTDLGILFLTQLPLTLEFSSQRGYHISWKTAKEGPDVPPIFLQVVRTKNKVSATTEDLQHMNDRITESLHDIFSLTNQ